MPGESDGTGTATGATGTGGPLPAERLANSALLTTASAGTVPAGTIARSTTRSRTAWPVQDADVRTLADHWPRRHGDHQDGARRPRHEYHDGGWHDHS